MHEFVVGGAQFRVTGETPKARDIDQRLRMLDPKADGKGFASRYTRRCSSMRNVSRELCPSASTT